MHKHALNALVPLQTRVNHTEAVSNGCNGFKFLDERGISLVTGRSMNLQLEGFWIKKRKFKLGGRMSLRPVMIRFMCVATSFIKILAMCLEVAVDSVRGGIRLY